ncbi:HAD family hydrolase [Luteimonas sp. SDU101]|uniref:HAD family hydrolase n=1 Tax=Luteimonas sp. SDU101 TaxID=3422593 RepID=UPI003EBCF1B1
MIQVVGFDADDTLWRSQEFFDQAQLDFEAILGAYVDLDSDLMRSTMLATERGNLARYGYGVKGMILSMVEAAIALTGGKIKAHDIQKIMELGKELLEHPVELLPGIPEAVQAVAQRYRIVLITKGDLFHQERKVAQCGLTAFQRIEVVSEKDVPTYRRLLSEFEVAPEQFAMVGNSLRSDIAPVVELGGWGVYVPYHTTWAHETLSEFNGNGRVVEVPNAAGIIGALEQLQGS